MTEEAVAVLGDIVVSGTVAQEVVTAGGNIRLLSGSKVGVEAVAAGGHVYRDPQATVGSIDELAYLFFPGQRSFPWPGAMLFAAATLAALLLAAGLLREARTSHLKSTFSGRPAASLLLGIAAMLLVWAVGSLTSLLGSWEDWGDLILAALILVPAWLGSAGLVRFLGGLPFPSHTGRALAAGSLLVLGLLTFFLILAAGWGTAVISGLGSNPDWLLRLFRRKAASAEV